MKLISIILTTYNSGRIIQRTLNSIFRQYGLNEKFNIELIVIDDCSNDDTQEILRKNNIEFLTTGTNSGGPNKGRNIGLQKANGDFICIMDHDDEWLPEKLISQLEVCGVAPIISTGYIEQNDVTGKILSHFKNSNNPEGFIFYESNATFLTLLARSKKGQGTYIGGLMFDSSLKNIQFEEEHAMVDFDWGLRLFQNKTSLEICKPLYIRHLIGSNLSHDENYRNFDFNFSSLTVEKYKNIYPKHVKAFYRRANGTMGRYYYHKEDMIKARSYFIHAGFSLKILLYYLTSFYGYKFINKKFQVF